MIIKKDCNKKKIQTFELVEQKKKNRIKRLNLCYANISAR